MGESMDVIGVRPQVGAMVPLDGVAENGAEDDGDAVLYSDNKLITEEELYFRMMKTVSPLPLSRTQAVVNTVLKNFTDSGQPPACGNTWFIWLPSFETWLCFVGFFWIRWVHHASMGRVPDGQQALRVRRS